MELKKIYLEGLDLAGKSSVIKVLGAIIPATVNHLSYLGDRYSNPLVLEAEKLHNDKDTPREQIIDAFYNASKYDLEHYDWEGKNILQDSSFIARTLAHNGKNPYALEKFNKLIPILPIFNITIILTAQIKTRQERLEERILYNPELVSPDDKLVLDNPDKFLEKESSLIFHTQRIFDAKIIDTTSTTSEEVAEIIISKLI
jgi:thymidylate kinase